MTDTLITSDSLVKRSKVAGYGVFASRPLAEGEIIEQARVIPILKGEIGSCLQTYLFHWDEQHHAISLGFGSLYNHSQTPNVSYKADYDHNLIVFKARRPIDLGEELFISYGKNWFRDNRVVQYPRTSKKWVMMKWGVPILVCILWGLGVGFFLSN